LHAKFDEVLGLLNKFLERTLIVFLKSVLTVFKFFCPDLRSSRKSFFADKIDSHVLCRNVESNGFFELLQESSESCWYRVVEKIERVKGGQVILKLGDDT
jgi:hypothetical protein